MNKIPFTQEEKNIIAEFVYSKMQDILIVADATKLIEVLAQHKLIEDKEGWLRRVKEKEPRVVADLEFVLKSKVSDEQGTEIMDEYLGKKVSAKSETLKKVLKKEEGKPQPEQHYNWGAGKEAASKPKPFDTVKIGTMDYELIHGEFPHSRRDNNTYARSKDNPERIYDFDGHRLPFKIEIEESNYLKSSGISGDEIRKSCTGKLSLNGIQIFECGGRTYDWAFKNIQNFIDSMEEKWSWYPKKLEEWKGKIIKYDGQLFRIESFIVSQAFLILFSPAGKPRKPFPYEQEAFENDDFDARDTLKVEINSDRIWWYPTKKEIEPFKFNKYVIDFSGKGSIDDFGGYESFEKEVNLFIKRNFKILPIVGQGLNINSKEGRNVVFEITEIKDGQFFLKRETEGFIKYGK